MNTTYEINPTKESKLPLHSPLWQEAVQGRIEQNNWKEFSYTPETTFYILNGAEGLGIKFQTQEHPVWVQYHHFNGPVNRDSCVEIFLNFDPKNTENYINFEINAAGILQLGYGKDEQNRIKLHDINPSIFKIETEATNKGWCLKFFIPFDFILKYYPQISKILRGNLYKCADQSPKPHYLTWQPIQTPAPKFHVRESFGKLILK